MELRTDPDAIEPIEPEEGEIRFEESEEMAEPALE